MTSEPLIFIIDDDPASHENLSALVKAVGLKPQVYDSCEAFLNTYDPKQRGCLLLNMSKPGLSSAELQVQLMASRNQVPTILLTAFTGVAMIINALKTSVIDVIEKPYQSEDLVERIKEALFIKSNESSPKEIAHFVLASMGDGVITTDTSYTVEYINPVAEHLTGWTQAEAQHKPLQQVFNIVHETTRLPITVTQLLSKDKESNDALAENRIVLIDRHQQEYAISISAAPLRDSTHHVLGTVIIFHDSSQSRAIARQLAYQAIHDPLTGLINRREFERRLGRALETAQANNAEHVLCFLDLDRFKAINDTAGHSAGDHLLRQLGILLSSKLRQRDTLARLGGDEFAILLEHCPLSEAKYITKDVCQAIQDLRFTWESETLSVGVSIGVTPILTAHKNSSQLMQIADAACYAAKRQGGNRVYIYEETPAQKGTHWDWVAYLDRALSENRLQLYRQVMLPVKAQGQKEHYEILLRMQGPLENSPTVGTFIPTARRPDLAPILGRWIVRYILKWLISHPQRLLHLETCAITLSRHTLFEDEKFPHFFNQWLKSSGVSPSKLCFAMSENVITANLAEAKRFLEELKGYGCRIAVDNFASTMAGFSYLKSIPVDFMKIDGYLIKDMVTNPVAHATVKSINEIAHAMQVKTIAKFVDNPDIDKQVRALGIDYLQGQYIAELIQLDSNL